MTTSLFPLKPFLKWAGGKSQLLKQIQNFYPEELKNGTIQNYYEPFLGGGAVFFHIMSHYQVKNAYLWDINQEVILVYKVVQRKVEKLLEHLEEYQCKYNRLEETKRLAYFLQVRELYNQKRSSITDNLSADCILRAAQMIFLNKTCFNGLFRVNQKGEFNVPFGKYKKPKILDPDNLTKVSEILRNVELKKTDFGELERIATMENAFVYLDPPYRPLSKTSSFTSYSQTGFDEPAQYRLANTYQLLDKKGAKLMLSNSNPKNVNPQDDFFEQQYGQFYRHSVSANRMINSVATKRGQITELLITNYPTYSPSSSPFVLNS